MKNNHSTNRGSALMMAIVMTLLLFIIGTAFLMSARTDTQTVAAVDDLATSDNAVQAVIGQINAVLVGDLFGNDDLLLNNDAGDEPYDYPYHLLFTPPGATDIKSDLTRLPGLDGTFLTADDILIYNINSDPWLADIEPTMVDYRETGNPADYDIGFRHITDLYGTLANYSDYSYINPDRNLTTGLTVSNPNLQYWDAENERISFRNLRAVILSDNDALEPGDKADADGDGVADARWVPIPNITGPRGEACYTAVRIIDNCAMINVNTALRNPRSTSINSNQDDWDGTRQTHINLEGIRSDTDITANLNGTHILFARWGTVPFSPPDFDDYLTDERFDTEVARRLKNPLPFPGTSPPEYYTPFDLTDELAIRNRFFLWPNIQSRLGLRNDALSINIWQATFNPQAFPGRGTLIGTYEDDTIAKWFNILKTDIDESGWSTSDDVIGNYNRRHIVTTYSFDRIVTPEIANFNGYSSGTLTVGSDTMPADLAQAWAGWNHWNASKTFKSVSIDFIVANKTQQNLSILAAAVWLGLPEGSVLNSLPQFNTLGWNNNELRERLAYQWAANLVDFVDGDMDPTDIESAGGSNHYVGHEPEGENLFIASVGYAQEDADNDGVSDGAPHFAVEFYNPGPAVVDLTNWVLVTGGATINLTGAVPAGGSAGVCDDPLAATGFSELAGDAAGFFNGIGPFTFNSAGDKIELRKVVATKNVLFDTFQIPGYPSATGNKRWQAVRGSNQTIHFTVEGNNAEYPCWPKPATGFTGYPWAVIAGAFPAFTPTSNNTNLDFNNLLNHNALTLCELLLSSTLGTIDIGGDATTLPNFWDNIRGTPLALTQSYTARMNPVAKFYDGILRYITLDGLLNPSGDGVDNDGLDTDADGNPVDDKNELAIAGRININTAPWFVIAQLPWLYDTTLAATPEMLRYNQARAIVAYRDKLRTVYGGTNIGVDYDDYDTSGALITNGREVGSNITLPPSGIREIPGFAALGELTNITQDTAATNSSHKYTYDASFDIRRYALDATNNNSATAPDDPYFGHFNTDNVQDDLLERDILLHRVSNLATVRSDVFTAYIAVRIGEAGPIRRVMAIFDRSNVFSTSDTPRLVALQPVADPD